MSCIDRIMLCLKNGLCNRICKLQNCLLTIITKSSYTSLRIHTCNTCTECLNCCRIFNIFHIRPCCKRTAVILKSAIIKLIVFKLTLNAKVFQIIFDFLHITLGTCLNTTMNKRINMLRHRIIRYHCRTALIFITITIIIAKLFNSNSSRSKVTVITYFIVLACFLKLVDISCHLCPSLCESRIIMLCNLNIKAVLHSNIIKTFAILTAIIKKISINTKLSHCFLLCSLCPQLKNTYCIAVEVAIKTFIHNRRNGNTCKIFINLNTQITNAAITKNRISPTKYIIIFLESHCFSHTRTNSNLIHIKPWICCPYSRRRIRHSVTHQIISENIMLACKLTSFQILCDIIVRCLCLLRSLN